MRTGVFVALLGLPSAGCDVVFGLTGEPSPCELPEAAFDGSTPADLGPADDFTISPDRELAIVQIGGAVFEVKVGSPDLTPIDLGVYPQYSLSFAPEGDALFYSIVVEPPVLHAAARQDGGAYLLERPVPRATYAGTPSAFAFGPRRTITRVHDVDPAVQEFEDDAGTWKPVGEPHELSGTLAPNLVPNGLTMVWSDRDADGDPVVLAADRTSTDAWFGAPRVVLRGASRSPQLGGHKCSELFTSDDGRLTRRDR